MPELKKKYKKLLIAACFPDVFTDENLDGVELISIAEAHQRFGDIGQFNIYGIMDKWKWKGTVTEAFKKLYL